jgi:hypothetical protein
MERNIARIANLTPEQIRKVDRLMSRNVRYAYEMTEVIEMSGRIEGPISDMEIRAALYTIAGSPRVTEVLDMVEKS